MDELKKKIEELVEDYNALKEKCGENDWIPNETNEPYEEVDDRPLFIRYIAAAAIVIGVIASL